eukprot:GHVT01068901.1.p1 GENE.GHVT01068901.1~~GHVT01068901.1.p1  ORF type:complete len:522 (+),score=16.65 GHVT01068901.1:1088-2653(+)
MISRPSVSGVPGGSQRLQGGHDYVDGERVVVLRRSELKSNVGYLQNHISESRKTRRKYVRQFAKLQGAIERANQSLLYRDELRNKLRDAQVRLWEQHLQMNTPILAQCADPGEFGLAPCVGRLFSAGGAAQSRVRSQPPHLRRAGTALVAASRQLPENDSPAGDREGSKNDSMVPDLDGSSQGGIGAFTNGAPFGRRPNSVTGRAFSSVRFRSVPGGGAKRTTICGADNFNSISKPGRYVIIIDSSKSIIRNLKQIKTEVMSFAEQSLKAHGAWLKVIRIGRKPSSSMEGVMLEMKDDPLREAEESLAAITHSSNDADVSRLSEALAASVQLRPRAVYIIMIDAPGDLAERNRCLEIVDKQFRDALNDPNYVAFSTTTFTRKPVDEIQTAAPEVPTGLPDGNAWMASQIALRYVSFFGSLNDPDKFFVSLCERTALTNEKSARTFLAQPREELWNAIRSTLKDTKKLQEHNRKLKNQEERLNKLIQILPLWRYELHLENAINKLLLADKGQVRTNSPDSET